MNKKIINLITLMILVNAITIFAECPNEPTCKDYDWQNADYSQIDWTKVTDFTNVDLTKIPLDKWNNINQANIPSNKISQIPTSKFNPKQITKENLKFATELQIYEKISEFDNLRDANPIEVNKAFSRAPYNINIDITGATSIKYDKTANKLVGEFPSYNPEDYPKNKFKQSIIGTEVIITNLADKSEVRISGAQEFSTQQDGSIKLTAKANQDSTVKGNAFGTMELTDGRIIKFDNSGIIKINPNGNVEAEDAKSYVLKKFDIEGVNSLSDTFKKNIGTDNYDARKRWYESNYNDKYTGSAEQNIKSFNDIKSGNKYLNQIEIEGKFSKIGNAYSLESFNGKQSSYNDLITGTKIKSTGYLLAILRLGDALPSQLSGIRNGVSYNDKSLFTKGAVDVLYKDFHIMSSSEKSKFGFENGITSAQGKLIVEDPGMVYEGVADASQLTRLFKKDDELIKIDGEEGDIAKLLKKIQVGDLASGKTDKSLIETTITKKDGKVQMEIDPNSYLSITDLSNQKSKYLLLDKNLFMQLGNKDAYFAINTEFGLRYESKGNEVNFASPINTVLRLGEDMSWQTKAGLFFAAGMEQQGISYIKKIAEDSKGTKKGAQADLYVATYYLQNGKIEEGRKQLNELISANPASVEAKTAEKILKKTDSQMFIEASLRANEMNYQQWEQRLGYRGFYAGKDSFEKIKDQPISAISEALNTLHPAYFAQYMNAEVSKKTTGLDVARYDKAVLEQGLNLASNLIQKGVAEDIPAALAIIENNGKSYDINSQKVIDLYKEAGIDIDPNIKLIDPRTSQMKSFSQSVSDALRKDPMMQIALETSRYEASDFSNEEIEKKKLDAAIKYRNEENYVAAAAITKQLSSSTNPEIAKQASQINKDITGEGWFSLSDETISFSAADNLIALANPASFVGYGLLAKGGTALLSKSQITSKLLKLVATGKETLAAKAIQKATFGKVNLEKTITAKIISETAWEGFETGVGMVPQVGPGLEYFAMMLDGGPDADYYVKKQLKEIEFKDTNLFHVEEGIESKVVIADPKLFKDNKNFKEIKEFDEGVRIKDTEGKYLFIAKQEENLKGENFHTTQELSDGIQQAFDEAEVEKKYKQSQTEIENTQGYEPKQDFIEPVEIKQTEGDIELTERATASPETPFISEGTPEEIITATKNELDNVAEVLKNQELDDVAFHSKNYAFGSTETIERIISKSSQGGGSKTLTRLELTKLTHANSLTIGKLKEHAVGSELVYQTNEVVRDYFKSIDTDANVYRGPNGAVLVESDVITSQQIRDSIPEIKRRIDNALPDGFGKKGVTGELRVGVTKMDIQPGLDREKAKEIYYVALQKAGAASEYEKKVPGPKDFDEVTASMLQQDVDIFIEQNFNYIPPEAEENSLFVVKDQKSKVENLESRVRTLSQRAEAGDISVTSELNSLTDELNTESTILVAMSKRPSRFESNVKAVFEGKEVPILNFKATRTLEERLIQDKVPFRKAKGDLDNLRDLFKTYPVKGADSQYASFYTESAKAIRQYENEHPGVKVYMEKQSASDEYGLLITGATEAQARDVVEVTRQTMEEVGSRQKFTKIDKVTGKIIEKEGGVTTTIGFVPKEITTKQGLEEIETASEAALNVRKYVPGKNTIGDIDTLTNEQIEGILNTWADYAGTGKIDAMKQIRDSVNQYMDILEKRAKESEKINELVNRIKEEINKVNEGINNIESIQNHYETAAVVVEG